MAAIIHSRELCSEVNGEMTLSEEAPRSLPGPPQSAAEGSIGRRVEQPSPNIQRHVVRIRSTSCDCAHLILCPPQKRMWHLKPCVRILGHFRGPLAPMWRRIPSIQSCMGARPIHQFFAPGVRYSTPLRGQQILGNLTELFSQKSFKLCREKAKMLAGELAYQSNSTGADKWRTACRCVKESSFHQSRQIGKFFLT
jgi:hypothetical protein